MGGLTLINIAYTCIKVHNKSVVGYFGTAQNAESGT